MVDWCEAFQVPLSAHTAPALHARPCCAANRARAVEFFQRLPSSSSFMQNRRSTKNQTGKQIFPPRLFLEHLECMDYQPIENYGVIGDLTTAALVGMDGSI